MSTTVDIRQRAETRYKVLIRRYEDRLRDMITNAKTDLDTVQYRSGRPFPTVPPFSTQVYLDLMQDGAVINYLAELLRE